MYAPTKLASKLKESLLRTKQIGILQIDQSQAGTVGSVHKLAMGCAGFQLNSCAVLLPNCMQSNTVQDEKSIRGDWARNCDNPPSSQGRGVSVELSSTLPGQGNGA
jgi:hypothetical protein